MNTLTFLFTTLSLLAWPAAWTLDHSSVNFSSLSTSCNLAVTGPTSVCPNEPVQFVICESSPSTITIYADNNTDTELKDEFGMIHPIYTKSQYLMDINCAWNPPCQIQTVAQIATPLDPDNSGLYCTEVTFVFNSCSGTVTQLSFQSRTNIGDCGYGDLNSAVIMDVTAESGFSLFVNNPDAFPQEPPLSDVCNDAGPVHLRMDCLPCGQTTNYDIDWQYRDQGSAWISPGYPSASCFVIPDVATSLCQDPDILSITREYHASTTNLNSGQQCDLYQTIQICCPIEITGLTGALTLADGSQVPLSSKICQDDFPLDLSAAVTANKTLSPLPPDLTIQWELVSDVTGTVSFTNTASITTASVNAAQSLGLQVSIGYAGCNQCSIDSRLIAIDIEEAPICGVITGPSKICPLDAVNLQASGFDNCTPHWYMSDDPTFQTNVINLGVSNSIQNTNILPPESWMASDVYFRVICQPDPASTCMPCTTDYLVEIVDHPEVPVVSSTPQPANPGDPIVQCFLSPVNLTIDNFNGSLYDYTWYHDGLEVPGGGQTINVFETGNYWVEASHWAGFVHDVTLCENVPSEIIEVQVCAVNAVITCPDPCPFTITPSFVLDASQSYSTCDIPIMSYKWSTTETSPDITLVNPTPPWDTGKILNYQVTVTDILGCTGTAAISLKVCPTF